MDRQIATIPASYFVAVLGLVAVGGSWRAAARLWALPAWIGEAIMLVAVAVWVLLLCLYIAKWLWQRDAASAELGHAIQRCFIALVPASTMLVALPLLPYSQIAATGLFVVGMAGAVGFSVWLFGGLLRGGQAPPTASHVLYLPLVASNFIAAIVAGALHWNDWGQLFFGAGLLPWLTLESVVLQQVLVQDALPLPLRPTLGLQLAPPAVGLLAYLGVTSGPLGIVANLFLGYALLRVLILLRLLPWIREQPFIVGYWTFAFGTSALALAAQSLVERGAVGPATVLAPTLFLLANLVVSGIAIGTLLLLARTATEAARASRRRLRPRPYESG
jgi:tellurite resistance protein